MTDRIDLDELDAGEPEDEGPNSGDWFWRDDPVDAPEGATEVESPDADPSVAETSSTDASAAESADAETRGADRQPMPRVPRENEDRPAGIPTESGGAGAGTGSGAGVGRDGGTGAGADAKADAGTDAGAGTGTAAGAGEASDATSRSASGPHGGGTDDMTLAFTYGAATRLSNFGAAAADADGWADWVGLVGRVPAHVINKFQRDRRVDLDFFNGSARGPGERLADVGPTSMFYAERMVVVGVEGEDEEIAETADWEFVPLAEAAEKAGWEVEDADGAEGTDPEVKADGSERPPE